jgi:hypothetical protein
MNKTLMMMVLILASAGLTFGQWSGYYVTDTSELDGGLGMSWIDNQAYTISFQPDISIGNFGIGLGINLLYNTETGKIRSQDWDTGYDFARIIRYLRYGHKGDNFYARVGALDAARIGHGFILNFYNNQLNYDERKLGLIFDADFGYFGFESLTNNLGRFEVIGGRIYLRPLHGIEIPVLRNLGLGVSYITDVDPDSWRDTKDGISVWGADIELPLLKSEALNVMLYADHAKIVDYGSGQAVGFQTDLSTLGGFLGLTINIEKRFLGTEFIPTYFGPFYELLRYTTIGTLIEFYESMGGDSLGIPASLFPLISNIPVNQKMLLPMMTEKRNGWYAALDLDFFHLIRARGSFQRVDDQPNSGMLHLAAGLSKSIPFVDVEASYDKRGIETLKDVRTLDNRSVARVGVGYKFKPYLLLYMDYIWNFMYNEDTGQYEPQERFQPRLAFRYAF